MDLTDFGCPVSGGKDVTVEKSLLICHLLRYYCETVIRIGNPDILRLSPVDPASQRPAALLIRAVIYKPSLTEKAFPAESFHIYRYPVPGLYFPYPVSCFHNGSYKFMAQDGSRNRFGNHSPSDMNIAGTDRGQSHLHKGVFFIQKDRHRAILQRQFSISLIDKCFHIFLP